MLEKSVAISVAFAFRPTFGLPISSPITTPVTVPVTVPVTLAVPIRIPAPVYFAVTVAVAVAVAVAIATSRVFFTGTVDVGTSGRNVRVAVVKLRVIPRVWIGICEWHSGRGQIHTYLLHGSFSTLIPGKRR